MAQQPYYVGLDMGTNSCGWAVTDVHYQLLQDKWGDLWGSHLFDEAQTEKERRVFRDSRRQLQRKQERRALLQSIFAPDIAPIDPRFFERESQSRLRREDSKFAYSLFEDEDFTDADYWRLYPSIHHLIVDLMSKSPKKKDPRLVYLACLWLLENRGSFLYGEPALTSQGGDSEKWHSLLENLFDILENCQSGWSDRLPELREAWIAKQDQILTILSGTAKRSSKLSALKEILGSELLFVQKLLSGYEADLSLVGDQYKKGNKIVLSTDTDAFRSTLAELDTSDSSLQDALLQMEEIYAFACAKRILGDSNSISEAKVRLYEKRRNDLQKLKSLILTHFPDDYGRFFRDSADNLYGQWCCNKDKDKSGKSKFTGELKKLLSSQSAKNLPEAQKILEELENGTFLPKQRSSDNSVIPCNFYYTELYNLLHSASSYLPCLSAPDSEKGLSNIDKIVKIFSFKLPYYIGPLNKSSKFSWFYRKGTGKIYPWNFSEIIDEDKSEKEFIEKMQGSCTYLPWEKTLSKNSFLYCEFTMRNIINAIKIDGRTLDKDQRERLFDNFKTRKTIGIKKIAEILNVEPENLSGVDKQISTGALPFIKFKKFMDSNKLSKYQAEEIIRYTAYIHDKKRILSWLKEKYPTLSENEANELSSLDFEGFGKLSEAFLTQIPGASKDASGEYAESILDAMRKYPENLMQLLSSRWTFGEAVKEACDKYYTESASLEDKLSEMRLSHPVKRMVTRAIRVVEDIIRTQGREPEKIFIEVTRNHEEEPQRTITRQEKIAELYKDVKDGIYGVDKSNLLNRLAETEGMLQKRSVYLYCMQLGKDIYTGKAIDFDQLIKGSHNYDIDHIWPQSIIKDDSLDNIVLTNKVNNIDKTNSYPVDKKIQSEMKPFWTYLHEHGMMSDEKFNRLLRTNDFTSEERFGFVHRQLVETSQATKAVGRILEEKYKNTEIVLSRAKYASEYRHEFGFPKSRIINDMHHAKDAYLNIVVGNVFNERFTEAFFAIHPKTSIKVRSVFGEETLASYKANKTTIWNGKASQDVVANTMHKNTVRLTHYSYKKTGGFYDQNPLKARDIANSQNYFPIKRGLSVEKYGGYGNIRREFWILCKCRINGEEDRIFVPIDVMNASKVLEEYEYRKDYLAREISVLTSKPKREVEVIDCYPTFEHPRIIKVQSVLSLDGFQVLLKGISGPTIVINYQTPVFFNQDTKVRIRDHQKIIDITLEDYESYLESWRSKVFSNENKKKGTEICEPSDMEYFKDKITKGNNAALYEALMRKFFSKPFIAAPAKGTIGDSLLKQYIKKGEIRTEDITAILNEFGKLKLSEQILRILGNIQWFNEKSGSKHINCKLSTLSKNYRDIRLIDYSPTAADRYISKNLLDGLTCRGEL